MEVGKFYKSKKSKAIVVCTGSITKRVFSGTVVDGGLAGDDIGYSSYRWSVPSFKLFDINNTTGLKEGITYNIPKGCKATIKDGKVSIENNTKYYKHEFEGFVRYGKHVEDGRTTIITLCYNGDTKIFHIGERPCPDISGCVKEIDEIEFTNAYNTALKNLSL